MFRGAAAHCFVYKGTKLQLVNSAVLIEQFCKYFAALPLVVYIGMGAIMPRMNFSGSAAQDW